LVGGGIGGEPVRGRVALLEARTGKLLRRWDDSGVGTRRFEEMAFSPDGRLLASSDVNAVHLWEVATGREVCTLKGHRGEIESLAFSADGRRIASASQDSTVLLWDLALVLHVAGSKAVAPGEDEMAVWWGDLAGPDAHRAYTAIWRLADAPAVSVPFLGERLKPVTEAQRKEIRQHIAALDSDTFVVRDKAFQQLRNLGPAAAADLRLVLEKSPSLELRRRVEQLLEDLSGQPMAGEPLRTLRAVAVLERAGTPKARHLLQTLAGGLPDAWLTRETKAVCERLAPRTAP
jgi:hypothetical protein